MGAMSITATQKSMLIFINHLHIISNYGLFDVTEKWGHFTYA